MSLPYNIREGQLLFFLLLVRNKHCKEAVEFAVPSNALCRENKLGMPSRAPNKGVTGQGRPGSQH